MCKTLIFSPKPAVFFAACCLFFVFAGVLGAEPLGEGVAANSVDAQGETSPSSIIELPQIVTYVSPPVAEQRLIFSSSDIEKSGLQTLSDVVRQAGIQSLDYGSYGLESKPSIRGFTDETVRVVIDGLCMNNPQSGTFDFSTVDISDAETIEIVRGGFTEGTEDEGAVGGVIYITTKKSGLGQEFRSETAIKSFFNGNFPLDTMVQGLGFSAALSDNSFLEVSGRGAFAKNAFLYQPSLGGGLSVREHSAVKDGTGNLRFTRWQGGGRVTAGAWVYGGDKEIPGVEFSANQGRQKDLNWGFSLSSFSPGVLQVMNLSSNLGFFFSDRKYSDNYGPSRHKLWDFKGSVSGDFYRRGIVCQSAGLSFELSRLNSTNSGIHLQPTGVFKETTKLFFNEFLSLSVPLAVKFSGKNAAFVPKIGLAAKFSRIEILLDGYRMVQFPNMDDLYWEGSGFRGNPDLKPEEGWGGELAFNFKNRFLPSSVQFFSAFYEKKIAWSGGTPQNVNSAFYFGIDFNLQGSFFDGLLEFKASGEYLYNELLDRSNPLTYKKRIMWTPDFTASVQASINLKSWDFTVSAQYTGKRYKSNLNVDFLEPYTLVNLCLNLKVSKTAVPYLKAENIFNSRYESIDGYPLPGVCLTAGCKIRVSASSSVAR